METLPLYNPLPLDIGAKISQTHWQGEAEAAERELKEFLGVEPGMDLLLVDRATHALELILSFLRNRIGAGVVSMPLQTYRAARDAARCVGFRSMLFSGGDPTAPQFTFCGVVIPTTLGGTELKRVEWKTMVQYGFAAVYDCAHTCYPGMFKGEQFTGAESAVLSFYPTKPLGAFGGGALIARSDLVEKLRRQAWPIAKRHSWFVYPQAVQSAGIRERIKCYYNIRELNRRDDEAWTWYSLEDLIRQKLNMTPVWLPPRTPHVLAYDDPDGVLKQKCEEAGLETGTHYPSLLRGKKKPRRTSLPFWTPEAFDRLKEVL